MQISNLNQHRLTHIAALLLFSAMPLATSAQTARTNVDESKVRTYTLPDPLRLSDGSEINNAPYSIGQRRPKCCGCLRRTGSARLRESRSSRSLTYGSRTSLPGSSSRTALPGLCGDRASAWRSPEHYSPPPPPRIACQRRKDNRSDWARPALIWAYSAT